MARPRKTGLDYFPKDVDTWDDFKIMDLVNEYGPLGYCVYDVVRDEVYRNGYYLEIPLEKLAALVVRRIGNRWVKDKRLVLQVIQYCADIGLFHNALLSQSVVTSVGIQRRYSEVTVRNKVDKSKYWLLEKEDLHAAAVSVPENDVSVTETPENAAETRVSAEDIPQKKRKVNKSKVNERRAAAPPSTPTQNDVESYIREKGYRTFTAERFCKYYDSIGWIRSGSPVTDWRSLADSWEANGFSMKPTETPQRESSFEVDELSQLSRFND